jgi:hypothetical protein
MVMCSYVVAEETKFSSQADFQLTTELSYSPTTSCHFTQLNCRQLQLWNWTDPAYNIWHKHRKHCFHCYSPTIP